LARQGRDGVSLLLAGIFAGRVGGRPRVWLGRKSGRRCAGGTPRPSRALRKTAPIVAGALLLAAAGCGESEGVADGAAVTAYVAAPLCAEAERELAKEGGGAGEIRVRVVCLAPVDRGGRLDLAAVGANARRATEDSTAIAYIERPGQAARFSEPIVDSAGIAWISSDSGAAAIQRVLDAVAESDSSSLRSSVNDALP